MKQLEHKAWTGGSSPRDWQFVVGTPEAEYVIRLFREQVNTWGEGWGDDPDSDVLATFWNRARHDAHATFRSKK